MKYIREKSRDVYLQGTQVENIFINEYLPAAPGDYVKVYIYASMYAGFDMEMNDQMIARQLGLREAGGRRLDVLGENGSDPEDLF